MASLGSLPLLLQLVDGAFPSGGFAHSAGLEAAAALTDVDVEAYFLSSVTAAARGSLPFVRAVCAEPPRLPELDALCDAALSSHVANRASRAQGRSFARSALHVFGGEVLSPVAVHLARTPPGAAHHATIFGAVLGLVGVSVEEAALGYLHSAARGVLSAGVRLGLIGPLEAQALHGRHAARLDALREASSATPPEASAQTAPLLELFGALHDEIDGRLFQS